MTPDLSHNLISGLTSRPAGGDEAAAFSQLRTSLIKVLRNSPESREPICDALELIEALQQQVESKRNPDRQEAPPAIRPAKAQQPPPPPHPQEYVIQRTAEGDFLTERRAGGAQPFRCPKHAYDAAARVLAESTQPLHFEELLDRLNAATGERQADYRLRVCLRFWLARGRVQRFRTRYRAVDGTTFKREAQELWEKLSP